MTTYTKQYDELFGKDKWFTTCSIECGEFDCDCDERCIFCFSLLTTRGFCTVCETYSEEE